MAYDYAIGNQLNFIEDSAGSVDINDGFNGDVGVDKSYTYDANGNVTVYESRSTTTRYNHLNLPFDIAKDNSTDTLKYEYDFSGTLHRISSNIAGTTIDVDYIGPVEYIDGQIKRINHDHGFIEMGPVSGPYVFLNGTQNADIDENWDVIESDELIKVGNDVNYWGVDCIVLQNEFEVEPGAEFLADFKPYGKETHHWTVMDHLSSVRTILDDEGNIMSDFSYYPFGMRWDYNDSPDYEWNRVGALEQEGIQQHIDVMAYRTCDRTTGRFLSIDPLSDQMSSWSPYNVTFSNPIKYIDPTGLSPENTDPTDPPSYTATGPTITISATRIGSYQDQTPERYDYSGSFLDYQGEYGFEGVSYENVTNYYEQVYAADFEAFVKKQDKEEAERIAIERMAMFAQYYAMIGTVVAPSGGVGNGGVSGVGLRTSSFNFSSPVAESNISVFRVYGGGSNASGFSWTPINPNSVSNFRNAAGLPKVNTGRFTIEGLTRRSSIIKSRSALPLDGNRGGLQEFIINPRDVRIKRVSGVNPEF